MATKRYRRDFQALEKRRRKAARLLARGVTQADVARELGVSRQSISTWAKALAVDPQAWRRKPLGYAPGLDQGQRKWLCTMLLRGAAAYGFDTEAWTLSRVVKVIEHEFGITYCRANVWHLLKALGFTCQRPAGRAIQRDEKAIQAWQYERWPRLKKKPAGRGESSSSSTRAA